MVKQGRVACVSPVQQGALLSQSSDTEHGGSQHSNPAFPDGAVLPQSVYTVQGQKQCPLSKTQTQVRKAPKRKPHMVPASPETLPQCCKYLCVHPPAPMKSKPHTKQSLVPQGGEGHPEAKSSTPNLLSSALTSLPTPQQLGVTGSWC